jgi:hypothetical protein
MTRKRLLLAVCVSRFFARRGASRSETSVREETRPAPDLDRVIAILHLAASLILLTAFSSAAQASAQIENRTSGLRSGSNNLVGIEPRLSEEAVREKVALAYELASDDAVAARGGAATVRAGQAGEAAVASATGLAKNTQAFAVNGVQRIPDFVVARDLVSKIPTHIIEAKNVAKQALTRQLRDLRDLVGPGGRVDVALPREAKVTGPLDNAFNDPRDPLNRIDMK